MSNMETHFGKLRRVQLPENYSIEDWCREKCEDLGVPSMLPELYDSWQETLQYHLDFYETYFFIDGEIWEAFEHTEIADDMFIMEPNKDGTISFKMRFYNGGTCLSECIEEGLARLKQKQDEN